MLYKITSFFFSILLSFSFFNLQAQKIDIEKEIETIIEMRGLDIEKAVKYTDSILQYNFPNKIKIKIEKGLLYLTSNKPKKALIIFNKIINDMPEDKEKLEDLGNAYLGVAQAHYILGNSDKALKNIFKALKIGEAINDQSFKSNAFGLIANIYYKSKDYDKAVKYAKKAIEIDEKNDPFFDNLPSSYNNLAVFFEKLEKRDSALYYHKKALILNKKTGNKRSLAISYNNIAMIYRTQKKYDKAIVFFKKAIETHEEVKSNSAKPLFNIAAIYVKMKNYELAKNSYLKALIITKNTNDSKSQETIYSELLKIAIKQKDYDNLENYQKKRDSLYQININRTNKDRLQLMNTQFEQRKKEEHLKQKLALNKKNNIILYTVISLLLFVGLFLFQKFKNSKLILNQEKLLLEQKVLRSQMNPHFIFNALTSIQKNLFEDDLLKTSSSIARFAKLIRQNFEFTNETLISLDDELEALKNYIETQQLRFEDEFDYQINIQKELDISYIQIPPMLLQPFVENAIEHGLNLKKEKGSLIINVLKENKFITFEVIDDGIGYTTKNTKDKKEHAIDIFLKRLKLRNLKEEQSFTITQGENGEGTKITFTLKLL